LETTNTSDAEIEHDPAPPEVASEAVHRVADAVHGNAEEPPSDSQGKHAVPSEAETEIEATSAPETAASDELPPAPVSVVASGETLGPQQALSMSEAVTHEELAAAEESSNSSDEVIEPTEVTEPIPEDAPGPHTAEETTEPTIVPMPTEDSPSAVKENGTLMLDV
jgi:hypothetical protein